MSVTVMREFVEYQIWADDHYTGVNTWYWRYRRTGGIWLAGSARSAGQARRRMRRAVRRNRRTMRSLDDGR